ncbi:MAG TPA: DUF998 domain-containing protein [Pseudonocardiaceae bacterium]|nr:DUF998 domain-containing protein [Pseudonocardiaceae bacterium]
MTASTSPEGTLVHSYLFLRRAVGYIGVLLPVVLIVGKQLIDGGALASSISGYYYSDMRGVFVGSMSAFGVFLLSYRGYSRLDDMAGNVAAVAAIGVALFPTSPDVGATRHQQVLGVLHLVFAAVFFLALAFFCLVLFNRTDAADPTPQKIKRNRVYLATGSIMLLCLVLIAVTMFFDATTTALRPEVWLETAAIMAFGVAWLTKGEAILHDLTPAPRQAPPPTAIATQM